jgi:hypothetical protein
MKYTLIPKRVQALTPAQVQVMDGLNLAVVGVEDKLDKGSTRDIVAMCGVSGYVHGNLKQVEHYVNNSTYIPWETIQRLADEKALVENLTAPEFEQQSAFNRVSMKLSVVRPGIHTVPSYVHAGTFDDILRLVPVYAKSTIVEAARIVAGQERAVMTGAYNCTNGARHLWIVRSG